jgi:O-methyltransferase involved in polyketide biosynthesis
MSEMNSDELYGSSGRLERDLMPDHFEDLYYGFDVSTPNVARVYDALLGGKDNYEVDRRAVDRMRQLLPHAEAYALQNRYFLYRAIKFLAEAGVRQFLDIGAGLPTQGNVHEIAQWIAPDSRVVYVDNDPVMLCHGRALLAQNERTTVVQGDLRDVGGILGDAGTLELIHFDQPVAVLLVSVLHFLADEEDPDAIVARLREVMAPGSYLVISHGEKHPGMAAASNAYRRDLKLGTPRSFEEIAAFFEGLELVEPGLVYLPEWRPEAEPVVPADEVWFYGGVARKPHASEGPAEGSSEPVRGGPVAG